MNNQKFIKTLNTILLIVVIVFAGYFIYNKVQTKKAETFRNDCAEFAKIISTKLANDDYIVNVGEFNDFEHETVHSCIHIFNYDETKLSEYEASIYPLIEEEFANFEFSDRNYDKMRIDIFRSKKTDNGYRGDGVSNKEIAK